MLPSQVLSVIQYAFWLNDDIVEWEWGTRDGCWEPIYLARSEDVLYERIF